MNIWRTPSTPLIAVYSALCWVWAAIALWAAPGIIAGPWRGIAVAALIAMALQLVIVLLATRVGRASSGAAGPRKIEAPGSLVLMAFSALFLAVTVIAGPVLDYPSYVAEWASVLQGHNPWGAESLNAYGPLFNALAPLTLLSPLANKLLFAFAYLAYVVWLIRVLAPRREGRPPSWFWFGLLIFNLYPWQQIAWFGYFDILVGLACVTCVHSLVGKKDGLAGAWLASGILLKFIPVVMLPFVSLDGRRLNLRLVGVCAALVALGFGASILIWGASAFAPLAFAATREPDWSIYNLVNSTYSPFRLFSNARFVGWLDKPLMASAILALFAWSVRRRIGPALSSTLAVLAALLFHRIAYDQYQMAVFCLAAYWAVSEWSSLERRPLLALFLIAYFNFLAMDDLTYFSRWRVVIHPNFLLLFQFALGCLLLTALVRFSAEPPRGEVERRAL